MKRYVPLLKTIAREPLAVVGRPGPKIGLAASGIVVTRAGSTPRRSIRVFRVNSEIAQM